MSRSGSMILCYHRIASEAEDPFNLCVTPEISLRTLTRSSGVASRRPWMSWPFLHVRPELW